MRPWAGLVLLALALSACTSEKARGIQVAATQFSAASSHAIDGFAELETFNRSGTRSDVASQEEFTRSVLNHQGLLSGDTIVELLVSSAWPPSGDGEAALKAIKASYAAFAAIFDDLDRGHLLAAEAVEQSIPRARQLTKDLVQLGAVVAADPVEAVGRRTELARAAE